MQKWEYIYAFVSNFTHKEAKLEYPPLGGATETTLAKYGDVDYFLNELGEQGWELCGISTSSERNIGPFPTEHVSFFFKRPKAG